MALGSDEYDALRQVEGSVTGWIDYVSEALISDFQVDTGIAITIRKQLMPISYLKLRQSEVLVS